MKSIWTILVLVSFVSCTKDELIVTGEIDHNFWGEATTEPPELILSIIYTPLQNITIDLREFLNDTVCLGNTTQMNILKE